MAFTNSFTGRNTSIVLPGGEGLQRSQENAGNLAITAAKLKYDVFRKNSEEFQKTMDVDPVLSISNAATEYQQGLITNFNNHWGKIMHQSGGNLSDGQKIQMMKDRRFIEAEGSKIQSMQKAWEMEDAIVKKNPMDFDEEKHVKKTIDFLNNGHFDYNDIPWRAKDFSSYIQQETQKNRNDAGLDWINRGDYEEEIRRNVPKGQEGTEIERMFHNAPEGEKLGFFKDFNDWKEDNPEGYQKLFDTNKDGTISPQEAKNTNPILEWAKTNPNYLQKVVNYDRTGKRRPIARGSTNTPSGSEYSTIFDGNKKVSYITPTPSHAEIGKNYISDKVYTLPTTTAKPIVLKQGGKNVIKVLTTGMENKVVNAPVISAIPYAYDREKDNFIFRVDKDFSEIGISGIQAGRDMQIAIPRSAINNTDFLNSFWVYDDGGKKVKIGDLAPTPSATTAPQKKKFNSNTGQFE